ncbi:glycosyltransferase family 2 protein [Cryomorpha ignava]|uniref:Glycosyltransferase family 2 protein n=1 Tax=Cryomorpha ignava TaxID=101383 RepID=A0A7K3WKV7_9FLAO|nr:glycosyltransferase family 2 protein [Cryomorpha ignava]
MSIIIPTLNEEGHIIQLIERLESCSAPIEIIIADGGSTDNTIANAQHAGAKVVNLKKPSRPAQLNIGADIAKADILYFVHADTLPPTDFAEQIVTAVKNGARFGCFRFKFDKNKGMLKFNSYCTRFPIMMFRGGDQSLFIQKSLFDKLGGYDESHVVMEDYDIIRRGKKLSEFTLIQDDVQVSTRKYEQNSYLRVNWANFIVFSLYYCGVSPEKLLNIYLYLIKHPKAEMK